MVRSKSVEMRFKFGIRKILNTVNDNVNDNVTETVIYSKFSSNNLQSSYFILF